MRGSLLDSPQDERSQAAAPPSTTISVLVYDRDDAQRKATLQALAAEPRLTLAEAASPVEAMQIFGRGPIDVVVSDLGPPGDELILLGRLPLVEPTPAVIYLTARGNEYFAAESIKRGAADYLARTTDYAERLSAAVIAAAGTGASARAVAPTSPSSETNGNGNGHAAPLRTPDHYTRILDALPINLAVLDERGVICGTNTVWRSAPLENHYQQSSHVVGVDYLAVCDEAIRDGLNQAEAIAIGLRRILAGGQLPIAVEYDCQCRGSRRWFKFAASPLRDEEHRGAIIVHVDITDRKQAELERDQLFEQSLSLLCIGGFDGYMRRWSRSAKMLGYTPEELLAIPLWELIHPEDMELALEMGKLLEAGELVSTRELRVRSKDGSYRCILWDAVACRDQGAFVATGQDITDRKEIEQQLRESHQRFQLIAGATKEAVWDWDLRENRLWQNDAYLQVFGTFDPDHETPVEWWRRRIHPEDRERVLAAIPRTTTDGQQKWVLEYRLRRDDGGYSHVYDRGFVIFDEQDKAVRMVGSIIDITALKMTEQKLRESDERFRLAAQATRDAIWDWDRQTDCVWRGSGFQSLFGYRPDEVEESFDWWIERIHPADRDRVLSQIPGPEANNSQQCAFEYRFRRADNTYADVIDRGFVMHDDDGRAVRMIGSIMDISERRRAEELAHMHQAELAHRSRISTMGEIATGIAHELNQPLTAINNYAESCMRAIATGSPAGDEKIVNWIGKIANNTHRAAQMIRRLRSFTRKSEPTRITLEVEELVEEVIDLLEAETRMKSMRIRWQPCERMTVSVDRIQIEQVLVNLLRNAYEAMAGNPADDRRVTITATRRDEKVLISVEDAGEGIAAENLERVFDAFFTNKPNGVGIGLAISRSIVEDHGGRLWVEPNPSRGVTFRFTLPLSGA